MLSYVNGYNDEQVINNEIESGKAVYQLLSHYNYDEAAKQYLLLVLKKAESGDIKEAIQQAILSLRELMKRKGMVLVKTSNEPRELVDDFNSDMPEEDFAQKLQMAREKAPKAVEYLRRTIRRQEFAG